MILSKLNSILEYKTNSDLWHETAGWSKRSQVDWSRPRAPPPPPMCLTPDLWVRGERTPDQSRGQPRCDLAHRQTQTPRCHSGVIDAPLAGDSIRASNNVLQRPRPPLGGATTMVGQP